jgi:hypothetical protein
MGAGVGVLGERYSFGLLAERWTTVGLERSAGGGGLEMVLVVAGLDSEV